MARKNNTIIKKFIPMFLTCFFSWTSYAQCVCGGKYVSPTETTRPGANELISIIERKPRKSIFGVVSDARGQPLEDVLVEVFILPLKKTDKEPKKRIIACTTNGKGQFCIRKLAAGKYEVFYSLAGGWKHTSLSVVVAPNNRKSVNQKIEIWLEVGT